MLLRRIIFKITLESTKGGNTISQKQQAYKSNLGVNRIAE
jgi:hypothetical protein